MRYRHVILEGKPTTGKTEVSNLLKIFFPGQVHVLPELTTVLVREHRLNILRDRAALTELLRIAVPARSAEVGALLEADPGVLVLEESHMGVHWAYAKMLNDEGFLSLYQSEIRAHVRIPDLFLRLDIPIALSVRRQQARATKDVEVDGQIVRQMFAHLAAWHAEMGTLDRLLIVDSNRSPDRVLAHLIEALGLCYQIAPVAP